MATNLHAVIRTEAKDDVVDVMCDAFRDYPVMRHVLGAIDGPADPRLRTLIGAFVGTRVLRREPIFAVRGEDGALAGAATTTLPGDAITPASVAELRAAAFRALGEDARLRYESFITAGETLYPEEPHHHLNMLGVRRAHAGRGLARPLLEAVHALAAADPLSAGVTLSTENAKNLSLYEHFGYVVLGHARVAPELETWVLFRRREP